MRILFTIQPAVGHFHPMVPLAHALEATGHEVVVAASAAFRPTVEASGLRCVTAGLDWLGSEGATAFPEGYDVFLRDGPEAGDLWAMEHCFAGETARRMVPDILTPARTWRPDLIVRDPVEFGGCVAAEVLGIPHAVAGFALLQAREARAVWRRHVLPPLDALRQDHGLPPDPEGAMLDRYLTLAFMPPALPAPGDDVAPTFHFLRPVPFDRSGDDALPSWLDDLPTRPTVYATLGTVINRVPGAFDRILAALAGDELTLILTVGRNVDPADFGAQPPNVHLERYIPQTVLLPRCDLIITHAGFNTAMAALDAGLPVLATPLAADQFRNAAFLERLGVARVLTPDKCTPEKLRAMTWDMLADPQYREAAARQRAELATLPGLEDAVALLEQLAAQKTPIMAA